MTDQRGDALLCYCSLLTSIRYLRIHSSSLYGVISVTRHNKGIICTRLCVLAYYICALISAVEYRVSTGPYRIVSS
jgi:hypothetical protein